MSSTADPLPPPHPPPLLGTAAHLPPGGLIAVVWFGVVFAGAFVIPRTSIRLVGPERLGCEDYCVYLAYLLLCVSAILQTIQTPCVYHLVRVRAGVEAAMGDGSLGDGDACLRYGFAIMGLFWSILWSVKASFLALYWKLFDGLPRYKKWWMAVAVFAAASYVGCWIASAMTCHPASLYFKLGQCYKKTDVEGSTISIAYNTTVDVLTDVMIIFLPLNLLYNVRLALKQKLGLAAVFSLGVIIILLAIARAVQVSKKVFVDDVLLALWGIIESTVSVIVGCLSPFKSLFKSHGSFRRHRSTTYDENVSRGFHLNAIRLGSIKTRCSAEPAPKVKSGPINGIQHALDGCGVDVPYGAIGVRSDYEVMSQKMEA